MEKWKCWANVRLFDKCIQPKWCFIIFRNWCQSSDDGRRLEGFHSSWCMGSSVHFMKFNTNYLLNPMLSFAEFRKKKHSLNNFFICWNFNSCFRFHVAVKRKFISIHLLLDQMNAYQRIHGNFNLWPQLFQYLFDLFTTAWKSYSCEFGDWYYLTIFYLNENERVSSSECENLAISYVNYRTSCRINVKFLIMNLLTLPIFTRRPKYTHSLYIKCDWLNIYTIRWDKSGAWIGCLHKSD